MILNRFSNPSQMFTVFLQLTVTWRVPIDYWRVCGYWWGEKCVWVVFHISTWKVIFHTFMWRCWPIDYWRVCEYWWGMSVVGWFTTHWTLRGGLPHLFVIYVVVFLHSCLFVPSFDGTSVVGSAPAVVEWMRVWTNGRSWFPLLGLVMCMCGVRVQFDRVRVMYVYLP